MGRQPLVLMVEDTAAHAQMLAQAMNQVAPSTALMVADNAVNAFRILAARDEYAGITTPSVVVLDANLPAISGMSMLRTMKSDERWKRIRVVVFSASDIDREESLSLGAEAYVVKPGDFLGYVTFARSLQRYLVTPVRRYTAGAS